MEGALDVANAELRSIMKRIWKRSASDKVSPPNVRRIMVFDLV